MAKTKSKKKVRFSLDLEDVDSMVLFTDQENFNKTQVSRTRLSTAVWSGRPGKKKGNSSMLMVDGQLKKFCEICEKCGKKSRLRLYQINFEEAYYMCENVECSYPIDIQDSCSTSVIKRDFITITTAAHRRAVAAANSQLSTAPPTPTSFPYCSPSSAQGSIKSYQSTKSNNNKHKISTKCFQGVSRTSPVQLVPNILAKFKPINLKTSSTKSFPGNAAPPINAVIKKEKASKIDNKYFDKFAGLLNRTVTPASIVPLLRVGKRDCSSPLTALCDSLPDTLVTSSQTRTKKRKSRASTPVVTKKQRIENLFSQQLSDKGPQFNKNRRSSNTNEKSASLINEVNVQNSSICSPVTQSKTKIDQPQLIKQILKDAKERSQKCESALGASKFAPFVLNSSINTQDLKPKTATKKRDVLNSLTNGKLPIAKPNSKVGNHLKIIKSIVNVVPPGLNKKKNNNIGVFSKKTKGSVEESGKKQTCEDDYCNSFDTSFFDDVTGLNNNTANTNSAEKLVFNKLLDSVNNSILKIRETFPGTPQRTSVTPVYIPSFSGDFHKKETPKWDQTSDGCSVNSSVSSSPKLSPFELKTTTCESAVNIDSLLLDCRDNDIDQEVSFILSSENSRATIVPLQEKESARISNTTSVSSKTECTDIVIFSDSIENLDSVEVDYNINTY